MVMYNLPILFGLYRRDTIVNLFQKVTLNQFNNLNYVEILASLFLSEKGKIYITKSNFLYRSVRVGIGSSKENYTINLVKKNRLY